MRCCEGSRWQRSKIKVTWQRSKIKVTAKSKKISHVMQYLYLTVGFQWHLPQLISQFRMRRRAFWWEVADATTSHQFFVACTGFQWSSRSTTSWPLSSTIRCEVKLHRTWSTTASWSWTLDAPSFASLLLMPTSSLFWEQTLHLVTGVSESQVREFGTVYWPHCSSLTLNLDTLNDF